MAIKKGTILKPLLERFEKYAEVSENDCWGWNAFINDDGYGIIYKDGKITRAHRVSYEIFIGIIPEGLSVLHKCDNPPCSNPQHLFLGTQKDNVIDMMKKGRANFKAVGRGEDNYKNILTESNVRKIREFQTQGIKRNALAKQFGVSKSTINAIVSRQNWSWLA